MALTAPRAKATAAAALVRAGLCDDAETGVAIITMNSGEPDDPTELTQLVIAVTALAVRTLLAANGFNVAKALKVIDQWSEEASRSEIARETP